MKFPAADSLTKAKASLAASGSVQIRSFLPLEAAQSLQQELTHLQDWDLALTSPKGPVAIDADEVKTMSSAARDDLMGNLLRQARRGFSFIYCRRDVVPAENPVASSWARWIASDEFLDGMRTLTGEKDLQRADAHACCYLPGHFLRTHDDTYVGRERRFAYVLNLSPQWQPDWGGLLHFVDPAGRLSHVFAPSFNSLCLFRVPCQHFVSQVASYARSPRLTITGWLFRDSG